jgi:TrmH family RNA methyltransferase
MTEIIMDSINSIKNEKIILARSVKTQKGRIQYRKMLLEGEQSIDWALERGIDVQYILYVENQQEKIISKYLPKGIPSFVVSNGIQKKVVDRSYIIPILGVAKIPDGQGFSQSKFLVVLDNVQDFGNMGTIIRTCHAFGIKEIISSSKSHNLYNQKTIDASRGNVFSSHILQFNDSEKTIEYLRQHDYQIVVTSPRGDQLQSLINLENRPVALIVGNETDGVSKTFEENADYLIQIPMSENVESLNVGVSTGISIYELKLKQVLTMIEQQIKASLGREMNVTAKLVQRALDADLKKVTDLTSQQVIFMMVLKCDQEMTVEHMCRQFGILENEVDSFLDKLIEKGLIVHGEKLSLTHKGEETIGKLWPIVDTVEEKIFSGFSKVESEHFLHQLQAIQANCIRISGSVEE